MVDNSFEKHLTLVNPHIYKYYVLGRDSLNSLDVTDHMSVKC